MGENFHDTSTRQLANPTPRSAHITHNLTAWTFTEIFTATKPSGADLIRMYLLRLSYQSKFTFTADNVDPTAVASFQRRGGRCFCVIIFID